MDPTSFEAYLARIGYAGPVTATLATLTALSEAHMRAIPFENLDILLGRPISLVEDDVVAKLVHARRGGYCFEQNTLFAAILDAFGFQFTTLAARVRGRNDSPLNPRPHPHAAARGPARGPFHRRRGLRRRRPAPPGAPARRR